MAGKEPIIPFSDYDLDTVLADIEAIRAVIPQRFEMEQLTAIVHEDVSKGAIVGYKDVQEDEFWIRGHMPGMPLLPGVLMCEAAAQLASYYVQSNDLMGAEMMGFGGLDDVRFRGVVQPGDRLVVQCQQLRLRRGAVVICRFEGYVGENRIVEGKLRGIPLPAAALREMNK